MSFQAAPSVVVAQSVTRAARAQDQLKESYRSQWSTCAEYLMRAQGNKEGARKLFERQSGPHADVRASDWDPAMDAVWARFSTQRKSWLQAWKEHGVADWEYSTADFDGDIAATESYVEQRFLLISA